MADLGTELVAELATNQSGLGIIYRALDGLVESYALHDAAIVIEEPGLGRQVFRAGRKPLDDPGGEALLDANPGLYTDPPLEAAAVDASLVTSLCVVALRMEVLRYDSWHDPLTGLFERRSFDRLLEMAVARSLRYHWPFSLVVIDLDGLKTINDEQGHAAGDSALQALGERFRRVLRFGDNAARIGGDEFAIILPNTEPDDVPRCSSALAPASSGTGHARVLLRRRAVPVRGRRHGEPVQARRRPPVRGQEGAPMNVNDLELELRKLPGVRAAGFTERDDVLLIQLQVSGGQPAVEPAAAGRPASRTATRISRWRWRSCAGGSFPRSRPADIVARFPRRPRMAANVPSRAMATSPHRGESPLPKFERPWPESKLLDADEPTIEGRPSELADDRRDRRRAPPIDPALIHAPAASPPRRR